MAQASTALKYLLSRGFSAQEAYDILLRLKDAAAFGRQASYSLADAVATATEGLKNENSILVDNAGVTKNVSKMWQEYAKERGIAVEAMTIAQKREAEYIGIMQETRYQVGDAAKLSAEFSGAQQQLEASTQRLKVAIGDANADGMRHMRQHQHAKRICWIYCQPAAVRKRGIFWMNPLRTSRRSSHFHPNIAGSSVPAT